jgi:hypothetical protein
MIRSRNYLGTAFSPFGAADLYLTLSGLEWFTGEKRYSVSKKSAEEILIALGKCWHIAEIPHTTCSVPCS